MVGAAAAQSTILPPDLHEIFMPGAGFCTAPARRRFDDPGYGQVLLHSFPRGARIMIGWIILVAVLIPALVLGRWAERQRRRTLSHPRAQVDPAVHVAAPRRHRPTATRRAGRARGASLPSPRARA